MEKNNEHLAIIFRVKKCLYLKKILYYIIILLDQHCFW